jgi:hypothetical protein
MARGDLSPAVQARIDQLVPDPMSRSDAILSLMPDGISVAFHPDSDIPVASVCLDDALRTMSATRYALFESHAHGIYFREFAIPQDEMLAIWFEQFYVQDAAHRLYSGGDGHCSGCPSWRIRSTVSAASSTPMPPSVRRPTAPMMAIIGSDAAS